MRDRKPAGKNRKGKAAAVFTAAVFLLSGFLGSICPQAAEYYEKDPEITFRSRIFSYEQMLENIYELRREYGDLLTIRRIGQTPDKRTIFDLVIGEDDAPAKLLIQAAIHGREYITAPLALGQAEQLLRGLRDRDTAGNRGLEELLGKVQVHIVPMNNPDGTAISRLGEKGIRDSDLKANLRAGFEADGGGDYRYYLKRWKSNAHGVDVNLNFPAGWDYIESVNRPTNEKMNRGQEPFSEEEAEAMRKLVEEEEFDAVVSYHSAGNVIYWDSARNLKKEESEEFARRVSAVTGYPYAPSSLSAGGLKDWMQCREHPVPGVTLEVGEGEAPVSDSQFAHIFRACRAVPAVALFFAEEKEKTR